MTFQIRALHMYNAEGARRTLPFRLDAVNIVTGRSATGKSSIIDIIDYCLGSSRYHVAAGVIRQTVRLYALELETKDGILLIARPAPAEGRGTSTQMHVSFRDRGAPAPELEDCVLNSDLDSGVAVLSRVAGIDDNITDPGGGRRAAFDATIRHALFFCIQDQGEIASHDILFHKQGEERIPQAIRDVLPYFLGTIDPEYVVKRELLRLRERELRELERRSSDETALAQAPGRAAGLLSEAVALGLATQPASLTRSAAIEALSSVLDADVEVLPPADRTDELADLLDAREQLRFAYAEARAEARRLRKLARYEADFAGEAGERRSRLQSLNLLRLNADAGSPNNACPLCESVLSDPITAVAEIQEHLVRVSLEISDVNQDLPRIQAALGAVEGRVSGLTIELGSNQQSIERVSESIETFDSVRQTSLQRAAVRGRVSLFLDSVSRETESAFAFDRLHEIEEEIDALRRELDADAAAERLAAALSRISYQITDVAAKLELEHAPAPVRLDARALTVIVDTAHGSYRLREIGSGANWLGYHLAALVGLHTFLAENARPVPHFLVLDQPSQVYFPPDATGLEPLGDDDHASLARVFDVLFRFVDETAGGFQVLVLEHADLDDERFADAVVERWRADGHALIPPEWIDQVGE
ncbi:MAG TPA: DUF3732 domain-containing protein [Candidatus Binatia bacterium]